ncbi:hypothetical protein [Dysgonomonas sp. 511]|uniref:hypothetical protein n=1 Tax=Dysgonomonas sp. 511 TaxID=2302930 RepID=UPI0013D865B6|nr:hypothetical protein [Dysgonomonas sp. 511]NDV78523.1 hypothetical protein [Dysgonomonas sp. 511]
MNNAEIKVGYLVSYDYKYIEYSLPTVYQHADSITIAVDKDRLTWAGEKFDIPDSFFQWIKEFDKEKKIKIYEDSFYVSNLTTMECDTRERKMLSRFMGEGGWHIQVDSDEYFLDFPAFINHIRSLDINKPTAIYGEFITIFKYDETGMFLIDSNEPFALATNNPVYIAARRTDESINDTVHYTNFKVLHQSWGRSEAEIALKMKNWSHSDDFNTDAYLNFWKAINKHTYNYIQNFHPLDPPAWKKLEYFEGSDIPSLIEKVKENQKKKNEKKKNKSFFSFFAKKR